MRDHRIGTCFWGVVRKGLVEEISLKLNLKKRMQVLRWCVCECNGVEGMVEDVGVRGREYCPRRMALTKRRQAF